MAFLTSKEFWAIARGVRGGIRAAALLCSIVAPATRAADVSFRDRDPNVPVVEAAGVKALPNLVHVDRVVIKGNHALRTSALLAVAAPYLSRDLTDEDVEALRGALTRRYTDHGFVTSTVILDPDAPHQTGVLSFRAIEGRIKGVRVHGLDRLHPSYVADRLRSSEDEVLNTDLLRSRLQRLSDDPLFTRVTSQIEPGPEAGDAILDVDVQRARPYSLAVALNNYRPPAIGEKAYDVSGQLRDLTGLGDEFDADVSGPIDASGGIGYGLGWQLPFGRIGSVASLSAARSNTVFTTEPLSSLAVRSVIERVEFKLTQSVFTTQRQQVNVSASFSHEQESTYGDELFSFLTGSTGLTRSATVRLIPEYIYRSEQQYLDLRLTVLHADLLEYPMGSLSSVVPDRQYFVWTGQLHHVWELAQAPFELESRAIVQRTDARISELHDLEIGGINSVRGFREDDFLASNVTNLNFDFRWIALRPGTSLRPGVTLGTFFDWATGHDVGETADTFSSGGFTLRLKWAHVQADLAYGIRLVRPGFVSSEHGSWQDDGIHAQLVMTL